MDYAHLLSVVIIGDSSNAALSSDALIQTLNLIPTIDAVAVSAARVAVPNAGAHVDAAIGEANPHGFRECLQEGLEQTTGEWICVLQPGESLVTSSTAQLVASLRESVYGVRHGWMSLVSEDGSVSTIHQGAHECSYPLLARWWLTHLHPHPSALFMRRALVHKALQLTAHHPQLTRYALALALTRCCPSTTLGLCTSSTHVTRRDLGADEPGRLSIVRKELALHSIPEQAALWRDYYISRLTEASLHTVPALLPHSKSQAQALASLLGESNVPMSQVLWNIYRDIGLSKRAVVYLSKWSSITENGTAAPPSSRSEAMLKQALIEDLEGKKGVKSLLLLAENLTGGPLTTIAQTLREKGKNGTTLYTVSYNEEEFQHLFADLAHRGLLGWVRPAIARKLRPILENGQNAPESVINEFNISQEIPQRSLAPVLDDTQGSLDCIIAHIDDPFTSTELAHLAEHVRSPHTIVLQGQLTASKIGPIESLIRRHRKLISMTANDELTIVECDGLPSRPELRS
jgi:hypothetical protein